VWTAIGYLLTSPAENVHSIRYELIRMHGKLKGKTRKRRTSFGEYILLLLIGVLAFITAGKMDNRGIPSRRIQS
jgi:hypothetical protein